MIDNDFFSHIEWFIQTKPGVKTIKFRETFKQIKKEDLDRVVIDLDHDIILNFPLNNNYSAFATKTIGGKQTLKSLLDIIYKFYEDKMDEKLIPEVFKDFPDIYQELMDNEDIKYISNADGFGDGECPPDFVGLTKEKKKKNVYTVDLGPI